MEVCSLYKMPERDDIVIDHRRTQLKKGIILFLYTNFMGEVEEAEEICVQFSPNRRYPLEWYPFDELRDAWNGHAYEIGAEDE